MKRELKKVKNFVKQLGANNIVVVGGDMMVFETGKKSIDVFQVENKKFNVALYKDAYECDEIETLENVSLVDTKKILLKWFA